MMKVEKIHKGIGILIQYPGCEIAGYDDKIVCGPYDPNLVSSEHKAELEKLGWIYDDQTNRWAIFT